MKNITFAAWMLLFSTLCGTINAQTLMAVCADIKGPQTYYYPNSPWNEKRETNKFDDHQDGISSKYLVLRWEEGKDTAVVALVDRESKDIKTSTIVYSLHRTQAGNSEQISFAGILSDAPVMFSLYPREKILLYSQQSIWSPPVAEGIRAFMFHATCEIHTE